MVEDLARRGIELPVQDGDLEIIGAPIDVLGVNYYFGQKFSGVDEDGPQTDDEGTRSPGTCCTGGRAPRWTGRSCPEGFTDLLTRVGRDYPGVPVFVTENGAAFEDEPDEQGFVHDVGRTAYIAAHLAAVATARKQGADVRGYFAWSLFDNFEWAYGYDKRFGIVRVDFETQQRTPKHSAHWYTDTIRKVRGC